jgi:outer membrane protein OmpA-like peptidoglycan-associated protein
VTNVFTRRRFLSEASTAAILTALWPCVRIFGEQAVCRNEPLLEALRVLHRACTPLNCDFSELRLLDDQRYRIPILAALTNHELNPVNIFFPRNKTELHDAFDWETRKQAQLGTFNYINDAKIATVYMIGRASVTGSDRLNRQLSAARMASVYDYLKNDLRIPCPTFRGAWMGREILQFNDSDAAYMGIPTQDYRGDVLVLNQAVHVFAVPCPNMGL